MKVVKRHVLHKFALKPDPCKSLGGTPMAASTKRSGKVNRRSEILRAAEMLMHSRGLSGVTTRQISKEVGCSEGALYFHFKGRLELLLAMLEESLPDMLGPLKTLQESVGRSTPHANLAAALLGIFKFHRRVVPGTAGLFAEPELLIAYRKSLARQGKGPHLSIAVLAKYIAAEQELGRIDSSVDAELAANLLMSSSFFGAFMEEFSGKTMQPAWDHYVKGLVAAVAPPPATRKQSTY
jgi:AcrR family transcriptional regulator